jgi:hypothetical protein
MPAYFFIGNIKLDKTKKGRKISLIMLKWYCKILKEVHKWKREN